MIYTKLINKILKYIYEKHHGQLDLAGVPYVFHPLHLAEQMTDEDSTVCALLHDTIEDTSTTYSDLVKLGVNREVLLAVQALTHLQEDSYDRYIKRVSKNALATKVKIEDLRHNMDITRLSNVPHHNYEVYKNYLEFLLQPGAKE